jgi:hypothetical protein
MNLADISFPVYMLGYEKPEESEGVLFYFRSEKLKIVDDKNIPFDTLADRRLEIKRNGGSLYNIHTAIFFLGDFIKISKPTIWFIDSNGKLFNHKKSISMTLIFRKIEQVLSTNSGFIIEVYGINTRFKCLYAPKDKKYAGLLKNGSSYILYGFYDELYKETRRMV